MHALFIYGTLKRGFPNHERAMSNAHYVGTYQTEQAFPLVIGGKYFSPCLINEPGDGQRVGGELFEVSTADLANLDRLEATHLPDGYRRIKILVGKPGDDIAQEVWTYVKDRIHIEGIHSDPLREYRLDPRYITLSQR